MNKIDREFEEAMRREALAGHPHLPPLEPLARDAPAPRLGELMAANGEEPTARALAAWEQRLQGKPIIDIAHGLGVSIELAKSLIKEVHQAVADDLKEALEINRSLDLARVDALLATHLPRAKAGKVKSAQLVLRCLERRAKLTGVEPLPDPSRSHPQSILVWIQEKLPNIQKIVDSLPSELPPSAPSS